MLNDLYMSHPLHQVPACCPGFEGVTKQYALLWKDLQCVAEVLQHAQTVQVLYCAHSPASSFEKHNRALAEVRLRFHACLDSIQVPLWLQHAFVEALQTDLRVVDNLVLPTDSGVDLPGLPRPLLLPSAVGSPVDPLYLDPIQGSTFTAQQSDDPHE